MHTRAEMGALSTLPKPMTARVLPTMDTPVYLLRSHLPAFMEASACATLRDSAAMRAMPCSAAATVLAVGALTTKHPHCMSACQACVNTERLRAQHKLLRGTLPDVCRKHVT